MPWTAKTFNQCPQTQRGRNLLIPRQHWDPSCPGITKSTTTSHLRLRLLEVNDSAHVVWHLLYKPAPPHLPNAKLGMRARQRTLIPLYWVLVNYRMSSSALIPFGVQVPLQAPFINKRHLFQSELLGKLVKDLRKVSYHKWDTVLLLGGN